MDSIRDRILNYFSVKNRTKKARFVSRFVEDNGIESVLFVGVGQAWTPRELIVESAAARAASRVVACDLHEKTNVPWRYVRASGLALPFADGSFDLVLSNAVIEHVGGEAEQVRFMEETARVGKHWIITTPNRWFPVESHTGAVLLHWVAMWRRRRRAIFSRLLSKKEFERLLPVQSRIRGHALSPTFTAHTTRTDSKP